VKICVLIFFLPIVLSCNPKGNVDKVYLDKIGVFELNLDKESTGRNPNSEVVIFNQKEAFSFLNANNNSIYFYDLESGELLGKMTFPINGENGVGDLDAYHYLSQDSVFVYSYSSATVSLVDGEGLVRQKFSTEHPGLDVRPFVGDFRRVFHVGNILVFNSWGSQREYYLSEVLKPNSFLFINFGDSSSYVDISYPDTYKGAVWGVQLFQVYHDYNSKLGKLVINYPVDNHLYLYDFVSGEVEKQEVSGAERIMVNPITRTQKKVSIDANEELKFQRSQDLYAGIKYFPKLDLYFRFVELKSSDSDLNSGDVFKLSFGSKVVQVIDSEFRLLGEVPLGEKYFIKSLFFKDDKIYFEKIQIEDEDLLVFDIFDLKFLP